MNKHTIEIEGLPEGWEITKVRNIYPHDPRKAYAVCDIQKTKPREITLVETDEDTTTTEFINLGDVQLHIQSEKIWRIKEE